ncbi:ATP-binding protein [Streptomyces sp. NPDC002577]
MSTTRSCSPGDCGPESDAAADGASGVPGGASGVSGGASGMAGGASGTVEGAAGSDGASAVSADGLSEQRPGGLQSRRLSLDGASGIVPLARDFTRQALYEWGWLPAATADRRAAAEDVLLVVSELVTNACLHAEGPESLWVACDSKVLRIEVTDRGAGHPAPRTPHRAGRPGGHGMFIVQRLCLDWGVVRTPGVAGKTVWAELGAPA